MRCLKKHYLRPSEKHQFIMKKQLLTLFILFLAVPAIFAQSIDKDIKLGAENAKKVEQTMGIYKDSAMTAYIAKVGQRLLSHLDTVLFTYRFAIIPDESPNAFSLPGGYIYITTGLIPLIETEDELAGILGHEIIHSNNRHTIRQMKKAIFPAILQLPGNIVGLFSESAGAMINAPLQAPSALLVASYSRKYENEADAQGVLLASKAGYEPAALSVVLARMSKAIEAETGNKESKSYFSDHPYTPDRSKRIEKESETLKEFKAAPVSSDFLMEFDGVLYGKDPARGVVRKNIFLHPDLNMYFEFPKKWAVQNRPEAVMAMNEKKNAGIYLMPEKEGLSAEEAAEKFMSKLSGQYKNQIKEKKSFDFHGDKAYMIRFVEAGYNYRNVALVYWLPLNGHLYRVVAMAPEPDADVLHKSVLSMRSLTDEERASIMQSYVHIARAKAGETLKELSKRTGNLINVELTGIINNHKPADKLKEGEEIKIVLEKPYVKR
jgi:predicted Zn-dependent protease